MAERPGPGFAEKKACLVDQNEKALMADGLEDALIGICYRFGQEPLAAYDYDKCIQIFVERDGMTTEDAIEYLEFNTLGAWMGEHTPVFLRIF